MNAKFNTHPSSNDLLIRQAAAGDLEAFNALVLAYQNMVYHQAFALLGDQNTAEDAAQESFIKAFENITQFHGGSFRAWLLKIATNVAYDALRRSKRRPTQPLHTEDKDGDEIESVSWLADPGPSVSALVEQNELAREIYRALGDLPDAYRSVLTLIDLHELDYKEAAQVLRIPIGTIKSRLARARLQMKNKLKGSGIYKTGFTDAEASLASQILSEY